MDELAKRYLRQQIEIGGPELLISHGGALPEQKPSQEVASIAGNDASAASRPRGDGGHGEAPREPKPSRERTPKDWRAGAPPIPGPGLTIATPAVDLLSPRGPEWNTLDDVARDIAQCRKCFLCEGRKKVVPGEGSSKADMVFVGEGPGQTEDETGRPFVGKAGELLTDILGALGLKREQVFICNVVKCRPPQNRKPLPDEMSACYPYLEAQLALIQPRVIVAMGATAAEALLQTRRSLADLRSKVHSYRGIPLVVTYHPAALLRNPNWKKPTWDDVRIARQLIDR